MSRAKEPGSENLLALNGDRYFIDDKGDLEVIFKVSRVAKTSERQHGLKYSLVLLNAKGKRIVCFDNAHAVSQGTGPGRKIPGQYDHKHIGNKIVHYEFKGAYTLVADFWSEIDKLI